MQEVLNAADAADTPRARVARLVLSAGFQNTVIGLIILNAVTLGLETSESLVAQHGTLLHLLDRGLLILFTLELAIRIYAFRGRFFRDAWGLFDLFVVSISWVPAAGAVAVVRGVGAMLHALPGMGSIVLLMVLIFYVFAVMATKLYGGLSPERFGSLGASLFTLFQMMTLESWAEANVRPILEHQPLAWMFFVPFILIATFVVLNLFIGVIVDSIQTLRAQRESADVAAAQVAVDAARSEAHLDAKRLHDEIRALREDLAALRRATAARG
jgi:voltage-gated sodium channel